MCRVAIGLRHSAPKPWVCGWWDTAVRGSRCLLLLEALHSVSGMARVQWWQGRVLRCRCRGTGGQDAAGRQDAAVGSGVAVPCHVMAQHIGNQRQGIQHLFPLCVGLYVPSAWRVLAGVPGIAAAYMCRRSVATQGALQVKAVQCF